MDESNSEIRELLDALKKRPKPDLKGLLDVFKALTPDERKKRAKEVLKAYETRR